MSQTHRLVCAIVLVAVATTCERAFAFSTENHKKLTEAAFRTLADPSTVAELRDASIIGDSQKDEPQAPGIPWFRSAAHYDNCAWNEGRTWVKDHRHAAVTAALVYDASPTADNRRAVIENLGFVLHATEDFYAHSNWVETHAWGQLANLEGAVPVGWTSGTYPDDTPHACPVDTCRLPFGTCSHEELNKDDDSRPNFAEAYADAILAVQAQMAAFASELRTTNPGRADAILTRLGLRAQPARISEAVAWPNGKVYFFQGSHYSRYDLGNDSVDGGYPKSIAGNWPGLDDLGTGIDAAFVAPNGKKAYFFRGSRYSRYDIAADAADAGYPRAIAGNWPGLWTSGLDAAVAWPNGKIYFFKGSSYSRYDFQDDKVDAGYPRPIVGNWCGLEPFSGGIDAVFVTPDGKKAYFFRGDYYIRYDVAADRADDGYPLRIEDFWPGL